MRRVLVVGAGQVGTFAARAIAEGGADVVAADIEPAPGFYDRFGPRADSELLCLDAADPAQLAAALSSRHIDTVVLATGSSAQAIAEERDAAWALNVEGLRRTACTAVEQGIRRFIYVSTLAVYGRPQCSAISESVSPAPVSEYGRMKVAAESVVQEFRSSRMEVCILRSCGSFGPQRVGRGSHSSRFLESVLFAAVRHRRVRLKASVTSSDEYIYVKDLGSAIAAAALRDNLSGQVVFNVGCGRKTTIAELYAAVQEVAPGTEFVVEPDDPTTTMPPLDTSRIAGALAFQPRYTLGAALRDYAIEANLLE